MSDVTGALHHPFGGRNYALRLTFAGIATLQGRHGNDLGGLLTGTVEGIPPFAIMLDMVSVALQKGEGMPADAADNLADDMLTADKSLVDQIVRAAFPETAGNEAAPKKAKR